MIVLAICSIGDYIVWKLILSTRIGVSVGLSRGIDKSLELGNIETKSLGLVNYIHCRNVTYLLRC